MKEESHTKTQRLKLTQNDPLNPSSIKNSRWTSIILILREMTRVSSGANLDQEELTGESLP